jgi:multimeric flavodoxin WrbA
MAIPWLARQALGKSPARAHYTASIRRKLRRTATMCSHLRCVCTRPLHIFNSTPTWRYARAYAWARILTYVRAPQGGGQEVTLLTSITQLTHHGLIYVPIGYIAADLMMSNDAVRGGSPWGAGTYADADGSRQPTKDELEMVRRQAAHFADKATKLSDPVMLLA